MHQIKQIFVLIVCTLGLIAASYPTTQMKRGVQPTQKISSVKNSAKLKKTTATAIKKSTKKTKISSRKMTKTIVSTKAKAKAAPPSNKSTIKSVSKTKASPKITPKVVAKPTTKLVPTAKFSDKTLHTKVNKIHAKAKNLDKKVLALGVKAHQKAKKKNMTDNNLVAIIDYSKPSTEKRFWVVDLNTERVLFHDFVAHGKNSGNKNATKFSNTPNSLASSFGVYLTSNSYSGKHGYSMRLDGMEKGVNDNARRRAIVMHGANYVSHNVAKQLGRLGRSWGCPALPHKTSKKVIDTIKDGTVLFAYYPDSAWLSSSSFLA